MRDYFRTYFSFSKSQQRGVLFLSAFILVLLALNIFFDQLFQSERQPVEDYSERVKAFLKNDIQENEKDAPRFDFKPFDPNEATVDELISMGLSEKQAKNIINYREKVGRYDHVNDLRKLYTIDEILFAQFKDYVVIQQLPDRHSNKKFVSKKETEFKKTEGRNLHIEINRADTTVLMELKGIGSYFANRIVNFRDALGGFHSLEQLNEVYGLKDYPETIASIKSHLSLDPSLCKLIPINTITAESLAEHPYFSNKLASVLINYREQHGPFQRIEDVKNCRLVTDDIYPNIAPYLSLE